MVKRLKREFKKQLKFGLTAAVGFLIAYAWRDPLLLFFNDLVVNLTALSLPYAISIVTALFVTVFGTILIWIISRVLK